MSIDLRHQRNGAGADADGYRAGPGEERPGLPVVESERLFAVDVLRGFALLGILAMNIVGFGWPKAAYGNPFRGGGFEGIDRGIWFFNHLFFEVKMMTIFSMLFGAGLVLMDQRAEARGARIRGVYYRRILWLLVIGLIHAYLIWSGDILVLYAECGLFLYFFRNMSPRTLIILGIRPCCSSCRLILGFAAGIDYMKAATARVEAQKKAGEKPGEPREADARYLDRASPEGIRAQARKEGQGMGQGDGGLSRRLSSGSSSIAASDVDGADLRVALRERLLRRRAGC